MFFNCAQLPILASERTERIARSAIDPCPCPCGWPGTSSPPAVGVILRVSVGVTERLIVGVGVMERPIVGVGVIDLPIVGVGVPARLWFRLRLSARTRSSTSGSSNLTGCVATGLGVGAVRPLSMALASSELNRARAALAALLAVLSLSEMRNGSGAVEKKNKVREYIISCGGITMGGRSA